MATSSTPFLPPMPPRDVATPLLRERIRALFRQVPQGLAGQEEAIHQMRVAGRRFRVALPLLAKTPAGRRVRRALRVLRDLTRTAGTSRDLDVIAGLLSAEVHRTAEPAPGAALLERRLLSARRRSRLRMAEALLDLEIARLRRDLRVIVRRRAEDQFATLSRLHQLRDQLGSELIDAIVAVGGLFDPVRLHDLRKRARRLRYAAEVGIVLRGKPSEAPDVFRELQGQLGEIHDLHVLASWLQRQAEQATRRGEAELAAEAQRLEGLFLAGATERHQALLASNLVETVERALDAMGRVRSAA
jgi:CHAD domain-containing protein